MTQYMQRRAAAAYFLFFLVLSIGTYVMQSSMQLPDSRSLGLFGIAVMSGIAAVIVLSVSYLPVRG